LEFGTVQAPLEVFSGNKWRKTNANDSSAREKSSFHMPDSAQENPKTEERSRISDSYSIKKYQGYRGGGMIVNLNTNLANN
jgi:hypothetical protein